MPSHPVKWYSSAMPGAPALRNVASDLIAVLDWCIVNGSATTAVQSLVVAGNVATVTFASAHTFQTHQIIEINGVTGTLSALNSQWRATGVTSLALTFAATGIANGTAAGTITCKTPSVGWQKAFSATNKAAYRSQDVTGTRLYVRVADAGTTSATLTGYETMSDVDTGGHSFAPGNADWQKSSSSTPAPWWVAGDARTVYFCSATNGVSSTTGASGHGFGDFEDLAPASQHGFFLACGGTTATTSLISTGGTSNSVAARSHTLVPNAVAILRASPAGQNGSYPNPADNGIQTVGPVMIEEGNNARGRLRGLLDCIPFRGPAIGTILDTSFAGYPGLALIVASGGADPRAGGPSRGAIDLIGPW